jgi:predicted dehydrogenase
MKRKKKSSEVNRRVFLKNTSVAAFMAMMGGVELTAPGCRRAQPLHVKAMMGGAEAAAPGGAATTQPAAADAALTEIPPVPPVNYGVIGAGAWGRKIITTLALLKNDSQFKNTEVVAVCDHFPAWLDRAGDLAPKAERFGDYKKLLAKPEVQAVVVATPTHLHRDIVLDALKAGKHVYCEAPLAHTIADAKDIARAAQAAFKQVFQAGLQERSHPHRHFLWPFIRTAALGRNVLVRAQWHKKGSWLKTASTPQRADELNWRLHKATSAGLMAEACIHRLDAVTWFLGGARFGGRPNAVTGFSSIVLWNDGRDVPDTVQCVFEFPDGPNAGVRFLCDATLCNTFDTEYEMYYGSDSAILIQPGNESRESKAWMFKEVDAPFLGWEGYARHDAFGAETGVSLVANASKQTALTPATAAPDAPPPAEPIQYALQSFTANVGAIAGAAKDYADNFGDADTPEYRANLADARKYTLTQHPAAGWEEGLEATVLAIKANEAALGKQRLELKNEFFEL